MESLKEWATVVKALEDGNQTVLLRKGGILETASGFQINSKKFLLYPTYEHQESIHLKEKFQTYLNVIKDPPKDTNKITSYAEVLDECDISNSATIDALSKFHIWSDKYIESRMNWMPQKPLKAIFLQVYTVDGFETPVLPEYQGCKSWIDINAQILPGKPVLSDVQIKTQLEEFRGIVN